LCDIVVTGVQDIQLNKNQEIYIQYFENEQIEIHEKTNLDSFPNVLWCQCQYCCDPQKKQQKVQKLQSDENCLKTEQGDDNDSSEDFILIE
jgi:hypothetical protein